MDNTVYIGDLAAKLNLSRKTIRYYEALGLMPESHRSAAGYRVYGHADVDRLAFILKAKALGLSLKDIKSILGVRAQGKSPCCHVQKMVSDKLELIDQKIRGLEALRSELSQLVMIQPPPQVRYADLSKGTAPLDLTPKGKV